VAIAEQLLINRKTVILWRQRFSEQRLDGLWEIAPGRGRKPNYDTDKIAAIVDATLQTKPEGMTHWSCRSMAQSQGVSKSTINNIWQAHQLKPHRVKTFKLSRDPKFLEKMTDVIGLYLNPPEQAIVLCVDEKSQIVRRDKPAWKCVQRRLACSVGGSPTRATVRNPVAWIVRRKETESREPIDKAIEGW
jgi:homeodomain-containing protein